MQNTEVTRDVQWACADGELRPSDHVKTPRRLAASEAVVVRDTVRPGWHPHQMGIDSVDLMATPQRAMWDTSAPSSLALPNHHIVMNALARALDNATSTRCVFSNLDNR